MNKSELKALAEKNNHNFGDMGAFPAIEITAENMRLLQEKFPFAYEFLKEFGDIYISKKKEWGQIFTVKDRFTDKEIISDTEIRVAYFECGAQRKSVVYSNEQNCFKFEDGQIIADNVEGLFEYVLSDESIIPVKILPETLEKLRSCGWYEGRRIDISNITEKFCKDGILLTVEQMDFLYEFGGIKGLYADDEGFKIYDSIRIPNSSLDNIKYHKRKAPTSDDLYSYGPINLAAYKRKNDMLRIGEIGNGIIPRWISTDGKLFRDDGMQLGRTAMEGLQTIIIGWGGAELF